MIQVHQLKKSYQNQTVIDGISFEVKEGEIAAFVGQNGAGKSTTLRMITGYLQPDHGSVTLNGIPMADNARLAKAQFGYVPENGPLYEEMTVREHLKFRGRIQGLKKHDLRDAVDDAINKCALKEVRNRTIHVLSKGYRQRVALADAMIGTPPILILDEPTNGLDPHQIVAFRELLLNLKKHHTIIISSHILTEMEQVADKVIIIKNGKIATADHPSKIVKTIRTTSKIRAELKGDPKIIQEKISELPPVRRVILPEEKKSDWIPFEIYADSDSDTRELIAELVKKYDWKLRTLSRDELNLESAFVEITTD